MKHATFLAVLIGLSQGASAAPGPEQGLLDEALSKHAEHYEREVDEKLDRLLDPAGIVSEQKQSDTSENLISVSEENPPQTEGNDKAFTIAGLFRR